MSDDEDPFEGMEDREGDPFEELGGPDDEPPASEDTPEQIDTYDAGEDADSDPEFEEEFIDEEPFTVSGDTITEDPADHPEETDDPESFDSDPFGENADRGEDPFSEMGTGEGDPFGEGDSAFEAVDVDTLDDEELWAAIDSDDTEPSVDQRTYSEVSKHRFCEQCEFFAEPPASHCTHEEARIVEFLDMEQVKLLNCPIVAEQQRIENEE